MSLFFAPQTIQGRPVLASFRAGIMTISNGTATADTAKGYVTLTQALTGLVEVRWQPIDASSGSGAPQPKTIAIPHGEATFEKVEKCTTGIVFALCLNGSKDPQMTHLFWLQEPNGAEKEADIVNRFKKLVGDAELRKRLTAAGAAPTAATSGATATATAPAAAGGAKAGSGGPITNESLQAIIQSLTRGAASRPVDVSLQQMLGSNETLAALREDPQFYMSRVAEHLPPGHSSDIVAEVRNPQASAAAATLQAAVSESPNTLAEVLTAFGLPKTPAAAASAASGAAPAPQTSVPSATALCEAIIRESENKKESPAADSDNANDAK